MTETVFYVPRLNQASVAAGACCPVPAEAILLPELELIPGVEQADADWQTSRVTVRHAPEVDPAELASLLDELSYPAESWHTRELPATGDERGQSPLRREAACQNSRESAPVGAGSSAASQEKPEYQRASAEL
jgi:hypothetical protein